jgi:type I restriction enzyme, S subunit
MGTPPANGGVVEVRPGYKRTEVGVIPEDWDVQSIGSAMKLVNGRAFRPEEWALRGTPIVRIQNLNSSESTFNYCDTPFEERYRVASGDVLFAWSGTTGTSFGARIWNGPCGVLNQHIFKVHADPQKLTSVYCYLVLQRVQEDIEKQAHGFKASFVHVKKSDLVKVALPIPGLAEQRRISAALRDVDALLGGLDRLIAKKRDLKQAAMQQLFTGQTRLPGFHGEWETKRLGELCGIAIGRTPPRLVSSMWGAGYVWLSIADLKAKVVSESKEQITALAAGAMTIVPKGSLLMSFKLSIGRLCFAGCGLFTNEAICSFNRLQANAEFLYYALGRMDFSLYGKQAVKGYTLNKESLRLVEVSLPSPEEQCAIAAVLSDMDAELSALEVRRTKTRALKQAMMQALLTGSIRLV